MSNPIPLASQRRHLGWFALIPLVLLILTACGGASTATVPAPTATVAPTTTPRPSAAASAPASAAPSSAASAPASAAPSAAASTAAAPSPAASPSAQASPRASQTASASAAPSASTAPVASTAPAASSSGSTASTAATRYTIANSKATYEVKETFLGRGISTAVGSTNTITGDLTIDKQNPSLSTIGKITVDISKLTSDDGQRDNRIRGQWLESSKFPTATFVTKRLEGLPATAYTDGQTLTFKIIGDLTVRNVTKEVTFDTTGKIVGTTFSGTAKTQFNMTDFGFDPPEVAGFLKAENGVVLTMTIEAKSGQ